MSAQLDEMRPTRTPGRLNSAIAAIVIFSLCWFFFEAINYRGLVGLLAEWQYAKFGRYFPVLTIILLVMVCGLILIIVEYIFYRIIRRENVSIWGDKYKTKLGVLRKFFLACAAVCGLAALGVFVNYFHLLKSGEKLELLSVPVGRAGPAMEGVTEIANIQAIGPVSRYNYRFIIFSKDQYFLPVGKDIESNGPTKINLFVEIEDPYSDHSNPKKYRGILESDALPLDLVEKYRENKIEVSRKSSVLFKSAESAGVRFKFLMMELTVFCLLFLIFAYWIKRIEGKYAVEPNFEGNA